MTHEPLRLGITWVLTRPEGSLDLGHNEITTGGLQHLLDLMIGTGQVLDATHAYIGVGDNNTAFDAAQTDLQAPTNKLRKAMNATFPARTSETLTFQADFTAGQALFAWNEWGLFWGPSGTNMLSRRVQSIGTHSSGTWTLTATLSLA